MPLRIWQKFAIVVLIPLVVELLVFPILAGIFAQMEQQTEAQLKSEEILSEANDASRDFNEFAQVLSGYALTQEPFFKDRCEKLIGKIRNHQENLTDLAKSMNETPATISQINKTMSDAVTILSGIMTAADGTDDTIFRRTDPFRQIHGVQQTVQEMLDGIISKEKQISEKTIQQAATLRKNLELYAILSMAIQVLIVAAMSIAFSRGMARGLQRVMDNSYRLITAAPLQPLIGGNDEIGTLDRTFHSVAATLAAMKRKERAMIDHAVDVICSVDKTGTIIDISSSCELILGYTRDEMLGHSINDIVSEESLSVIKKNLTDSSAHTGAFKVDTQIMHKSGELRDMHWSGCWSPADDTSFCILHDVSEEKKVERLKKEVLSMVSHDLRTPLATLQGSMELLEAGVFGKLNDSGDETVRRSSSVLARLMSLINNLLDMERLESGVFELDLSNFEFTEMAQEAIYNVETQAQEKHIAIKTCKVDLYVYCDKERMLQVLVNLLSNAVKFAPANSTIEIDARALDDQVELSVSDQGAGIPADKLATIFERFKQVRRSDETEKKGSGLGLAICKAIVQAHNGTLGVDSTPGRGSRFWLRLPTSAATNNRKAPGEAVKQHA